MHAIEKTWMSNLYRSNVKNLSRKGNFSRGRAFYEWQQRSPHIKPRNLCAAAEVARQNHHRLLHFSLQPTPTQRARFLQVRTPGGSEERSDVNCGIRKWKVWIENRNLKNLTWKLNEKSKWEETLLKFRSKENVKLKEENEKRKLKIKIEMEKLNEIQKWELKT